MRIVHAALFSLALVAAPAAAAESLRDRVVRTAEPSAAEAAALTTRDVRTLLLLTRDEERAVRRNARAWLLHPSAPDPIVERVLARPPRAARPQALLIRAMRLGVAALPRVIRELDDRRPEMRDAAARALAVLATEEAREALEARVAVERDRHVRARMQHCLSRMHP